MSNSLNFRVAADRGTFVLKAALAISLALHAVIVVIVAVVEPTNDITTSDYEDWVKNLSDDRWAEVVPPPPPPIEEIKPEKKEEKSEDKKEKVDKKKPKEQASPDERRQVARKQVSQKGLLMTIGTASEGGALADVFGSDAAVDADVGSALKDAKRTSIAKSGSGFKTTRKKGADGASEIGEVGVEAGGSANIGDREAAHLEGRVETSDFEIDSSEIDKASVRKVLARRGRSFQQCYERSLKGKALQGKLVLAWTIDANGRVLEVRVVEDRLGSEEVLSCMVNILKRTRFPKPKDGGVAELKNTFVFQTAN